MASNSRAGLVLACLLTLMSAGCCCTQGLTTCNSCASCDGGACATGPLGGHGSCHSGCGEVYVDEWLNTPPCIDDCGYSNCNTCGPRRCRPVLAFVRLLFCGDPQGGCGGCESGCSSCSSGGAGHFTSSPSSCNCGGSHVSAGHSETMYSAPATMNSVLPSPASPSHAPSATPTPAPVAPSSAKRLSPAQQRTSVARASAAR